MSLNNTPLNFKNQTKFIPAKPTTEKTMSCKTTHDHLAAAEKELRLALASVVETASPARLNRIIHVLDTVNDIKQGFVSSATSHAEQNFVINTPDAIDYTSAYAPDLSSDGVNFNFNTVAAGPVNIPGAQGEDVITFS
tara:strand:+ start:130 stop:543 length:414 start_codon:yes stop_codon:yes gene_type:complete